MQPNTQKKIKIPTKIQYKKEITASKSATRFASPEIARGKHNATQPAHPIYHSETLVINHSKNKIKGKKGTYTHE